MMSYEQWLNCIKTAANHIASREFQQEAWFPGGKSVSSPDEEYLTLMEDCTADLFFETYGKRFSEQQRDVWREFRSRLTAYYEKLPKHPDRQQVLDDPDWDSVRQLAGKFVQAFHA